MPNRRNARLQESTCNSLESTSVPSMSNMKASKKRISACSQPESGLAGEARRSRVNRKLAFFLIKRTATRSTDGGTRLSGSYHLSPQRNANGFSPAQCECTNRNVVPAKKRSHSHGDGTLLLIAVFKFVKGALLLTLAFGALSLLNHSSYTSRGINELAHRVASIVFPPQRFRKSRPVPSTRNTAASARA